MKKYKIEIQVNKRKANYSTSYEYRYGNHNFVLRCNEDSFLAIFEITRNFKEFKIFKNYINDLYKKISLIYLIRYEKSLIFSEITLYLSDKKIISYKYDKNNKVMYELVDKLIDRLPNNLQNINVINCLLKYSKSKYDNKIASLYAYLYAKSMLFENDRLQYYWMAFNGFYNKFKNDDKDIQDFELINRFIIDFGYGSKNISKAERNRTVPSIIPLLAQLGFDKFNTNTKVLKEDIDNNNEVFNNKFNEIELNSDLIPYAYILTQVAYYYRCNIFHANKPIDLFLTKYENNIFAIKAVNDLLEEFLDNNLSSLFN